MQKLLWQSTVICGRRQRENLLCFAGVFAAPISVACIRGVQVRCGVSSPAWQAILVFLFEPFLSWCGECMPGVRGWEAGWAYCAAGSAGAYRLLVWGSATGRGGH
eukprot:1159555-Pelagomonas_calceolata.AAC.2